MRSLSNVVNISAVAKGSGVPARTIRYYEAIGVITPAQREINGYRTYSTLDVYTLNFIKRARGLGFSVEEVRELLDLWRDRKRTSVAMKALARQQLQTLDRKIEELQVLRRALGHLMEQCPGDERTQCPILDELGQDDSTPGRAWKTRTTRVRSAQVAKASANPMKAAGP